MLLKRIKFFAAPLLAIFANFAIAHADEAAETFITDVLVEADAIFNAQSEAEAREAIGVLVDQHVDMRRVGLFTLGQYARQMTPEQRAEFLPLFKTYATLIYEKSLSNYSGQQLVVTGSVDRSARDFIVNSKIKNPAPGDPFANANIQWRVYRGKDGSQSVVDAGANDIWLAIEQRSQFTSVIANNGGGSAGVAVLISQLRAQVGG